MVIRQATKCLDGNYRSGLDAFVFDIQFANRQALKRGTPDYWRPASPTSGGSNGLKAATTEGRRYVQVPESEVDAWVKRRAEDALAECTVERGVVKTPRLVYVRERLDPPGHLKSWPVPESGLHGFIMSGEPGHPEERLIFVVADHTDEWLAAKTVAHETFHMAEVLDYGADTLDAASERRAVAYGEAYCEFRRWSSPRDVWGER